eukprot:229826-Rhodomonas_salina.1
MVAGSWGVTGVGHPNGIHTAGTSDLGHNVHHGRGRVLGVNTHISLEETTSESQVQAWCAPWEGQGVQIYYTHFFERGRWCPLVLFSSSSSSSPSSHLVSGPSALCAISHYSTETLLPSPPPPPLLPLLSSCFTSSISALSPPAPPLLRVLLLFSSLCSPPPPLLLKLIHSCQARQESDTQAMYASLRCTVNQSTSCDRSTARTNLKLLDCTVWVTVVTTVTNSLGH